MQRILVPLGILLIALGATWGLWSRFSARPTIPPAPATPSPAATATVAQTEAAGADRYRLAGTAVGEPSSFAAIELPDGSSFLYREGMAVPGLGKVAGIFSDHVVISSADGDIVLSLRPAPTATRDPRRLGAAPTRTSVRPPPEPSPDHTADESDSSDELDPQAF